MTTLRETPIKARERWRESLGSMGLLLVLSTAAVGCTPPPPPTDDTYVCSCKCDDECTVANASIAYDGAGNVLGAFCNTVDPDFPNPANNSTPQSLETCVLAGASASTVQAACNSRCNKKVDFFIPGTVIAVRDTRSVVGATRVCMGVNSSYKQSSKSCRVDSGQLFSETAALTAAPPGDTRVEASSQTTSSASFPTSDGTAVVTMPPPTGSVLFSGGNCPGKVCGIGLDWIELTVPTFNGLGHTISSTVITNTHTVMGIKDASENVSFQAGVLDLVASATYDGSPTLSPVTLNAPLTGTYSPGTGSLQLNGTFTDSATGNSLSIQFKGGASARPPVTNAGADFTVACRANAPAVASVSGAGSFDPDGDGVSWAWSENGVVISRALVSDLALNSGKHTLILSGIDGTGRPAMDDVVVTVTDAVAPKFTFVPPTVVVEATGAVAIGQATAADACGSVTVTNNAPSSFPAGKTNVTWRATDQAGNSVTAIQLVYVLPQSASACPAGTHVILGTANNDNITGTSGADCIIGFGGQDRIDGAGGDDIIIGGDGDDILIGGTGNDVIAGGPGQDNITGGDGNDLLVGGDGDDTMSGGNGNDTLLGGNGNDTLNGDANDDVLAGNAGTDSENGGSGTDKCVSDPAPNQDTQTACEGGCGAILGGRSLIPGSSQDRQTSCNGTYSLVMQTGGNLVLLQGSTVLWSSGTNTAGTQAVMGTDGNFGVGTAWKTNSFGQTGAYLSVQNDGNLVLYTAYGQAIWSRQTPVEPRLVRTCGTITIGQGLPSSRFFSSCNQQYFLYMQGDGNLVWYTAAGAPLWASNTADRGNLNYVVVQSDGNVVLYNWITGLPQWASGTFDSSGGTYLSLGDDGHLAVFNAQNQVLKVLF